MTAAEQARVWRLLRAWRAVGDDRRGRAASVRAARLQPADASRDVVGGNVLGEERAPKGVADYRFHTMMANLNIRDWPLGYDPPVGPRVEFLVTYNHKENFQPQVFSYSNLGPKWTFDWMA